MPPTTPINIKDLGVGEVVRVQLGHGYVFKPTKPHHATVERIQVARAYRKPTAVGFVTQNDYANRELTMVYADTTFPNLQYLVTVPYKRMMVIERQIPGTYVSDNVHRLQIPAYAPVLGVY